MAQPKGRKATKSRKAKKATTTTTTELSAEQQATMQAGMAMYLQRLSFAGVTEATWGALSATKKQQWVNSAVAELAKQAAQKAANTSAPKVRLCPLAKYRFNEQEQKHELVEQFFASTLGEYLAVIKMLPVPAEHAGSVEQLLEALPLEWYTKPVFAYNYASHVASGYKLKEATNSACPFWATGERFSASNAVAGYARSLFNNPAPSTHAFATVCSTGNANMQFKGMHNHGVKPHRAWVCAERSIVQALMPTVPFLHMATWEPAMLEAMQAARVA